MTTQTMDSGKHQFVVESTKLKVMSFSIFLEEIRNRIKGGERVVSYFASNTGLPSEIYLNCVFLSQDHGLSLLRSIHVRQETLPSLTPEFFFFHCFEREIAEENGIRFLHHPWLKPLRFSGIHQRTMNAYPFFKLEGKEIHEVGVGPIHAGVIEPGHFRFMCYGEQVHHLEIQLGYQHRGVRELLFKNHPAKLAPLIETIAGDTSIAHTWAYCKAWEAICGQSIPLGLELVRGIVLELERVAMHLSSLAGMSTDIAFLPGGSSYGRLRTALINTLMSFCGSRIGRGWLRPGEVRFRTHENLAGKAIEILQATREDLILINNLFKNARTVRHRLFGTGQLTSDLVRDMGFVGMVARSSDIAQDVRVELPGQLYEQYPIISSKFSSGDCWARAILRIQEIEHSIEWLLKAINILGDLSFFSRIAPEAQPWKIKLGVGSPRTIAMAIVEGWRGEVFHFIETDASGNLQEYRIQDPSLRNWFAVALSVRGNAISDFPICNKSFDLSYCGNDL